MTKYNLFVNGKKQGTVTTNDPKGFIESSYPGVNYKVNEDEKDIHLSIGILDAMKFANG